MTTVSTSSRIAIDLDGTLMKTTDLVCRLINYRLGTSLDHRHVNDWHAWERMGLDKIFWETYDLLDDGVRILAEPYDDHTMAALSLLLMATDADIVTCNKPVAEAHVFQWANRNGVMLPADTNVVCLADGDVRSDTRDKAALPYDIYIDDSPKLAEVIRDMPYKTLLLMNTNWNDGVEESDNIIRMHSWSDVIAWFEQEGLLSRLKPK